MPFTRTRNSHTGSGDNVGVTVGVTTIVEVGGTSVEVEAGTVEVGGSGDGVDVAVFVAGTGVTVGGVVGVFVKEGTNVEVDVADDMGVVGVADGVPPITGPSKRILSQ